MKIQSIVNKEIEDHFDAIVKAVHDRKAALLKEADSEFQKISMSFFHHTICIHC